MSKREKWVRRFEVNESARHKNGFTIYKITSVLFPISSPEVLTIVSVWKRYSEAQRLYTAMRSLHIGLQLKGTCPSLPTHGYFKRFHTEVISERAGAIKRLLEFVAEHQLLFTSTDFVNFLQTGYPEPPPESLTNIPHASISAIRASLHLPVVDNAPLEYTTSDDDYSPKHRAREPPKGVDETDYLQIPIYHASDYDFDLPSKSNQDCHRTSNTSHHLSNTSHHLSNTDHQLSNTSHQLSNTDHQLSNTSHKLSKTDSFVSLSSLESISSDLYSELEKITVSPMKSTKTSVLPDLINFDVPSTSRFEDYHTMSRENPENFNENPNISSNSTKYENVNTVSQEKDKENLNIHSNIPKISESLSDIPKMSESLSDSISISSDATTLDSTFRSSSRTSHSMLSLSNVECKTRTEDSYVFEAGYVLNVGARYEAATEYSKAFDCYKTGIEKMLSGVQTDTDGNRRALIKEKINKYLSYAENIYRNHLCDRHTDVLPDEGPRHQTQGLPVSMLRRPYEDLALYKVLGVLNHRMMLTLHKGDRCCYAMKVIQKIPNNLTEFDDYFIQKTNETKRPILPTLVPYMVPLISYIETENVIFLILAYAPGEKLLNYIKNYKSVPSTPARDVNLENVFTEPKTMKFGEDKDSINVNEIKTKSINGNEDLEFDLEIENNNFNTENSTNINENSNIIVNKDLSVNELLRNSKTLLQNVEKVLNVVKTPQSETRDKKYETEESKRDNNIRVETEKEVKVDERGIDSSLSNYMRSNVCSIPPSTISQWGAELLTAVEGLHNCGVVCRDLHPSNILLGDRGQVCLTYMVGYDFNSVLGTLRLHRTNLYRAPELNDPYYCLRFNEENGFELEKLCDYWSFGAIMYDLLCAEPLSRWHGTAFTGHTAPHVDGAVPTEGRSLLTQLLSYDPSRRLGAGQAGVGEIKSHPYFKHIDWTQIHDRWSLNCSQAAFKVPRQ